MHIFADSMLSHNTLKITQIKLTFLFRKAWKNRILLFVVAFLFCFKARGTNYRRVE